MIQTLKKSLFVSVPTALLLVACGGGSGQPASQVPMNTAPTLNVSSAISVEENTRTVTTVTTSDAEGNPVTLSVSGPDAASFSITNGGVLSFTVPADFEAPGDVDGDNVYNINVVADDTFTTPTSVAVTITVTDVVGDSIPETSNLVTTDDTTFVQENLLSSFEYPVLLQQDTDKFTLTGVFADSAIAQGGWNNLESDVSARIGDASVSTCEITKMPGDCDAPQGEILIKDVVVTKNSITFLMSGGAGNNNVGAEVILASDNTVLGRYTPNSCGDPILRGDQHYVNFDTSSIIGQTVNVRIFDEESGGCGFVAFDHFYQTDKPMGVNAGSLSVPLDPVKVSIEPAANTNLIPGASFEAPVAMLASQGWVATGAFENPMDDSWQGTTVFDDAARVGNRAVSTCEMNGNNQGCDAPVGTLTSPGFKVTEDFINFLMGGGNGAAPVGFKVLDTFGNELHSYSPNSCGPAFIDSNNDWTAVNVAAVRDANVKIQMFDNEPGGCGFLSFDHFYQSGAAYNPTGDAQDGGTLVLTPAAEAKLGFNVTLNDDSFDQVIGDFDDATANDWVQTGDFMNPANADAWRGVSGAGRVGLRAVTTCELNANAKGCDAPVGSLTSPGFTVDAARPFLNFLMAGGNGAAPVGLKVLAMDDSEIASFTPNSCGPAAIDGDDDWASIDLTAQVGTMVKVQIFDNEPGGCGFVSFDHPHMSASAK